MAKKLLKNKGNGGSPRYELNMENPGQKQRVARENFFETDKIGKRKYETAEGVPVEVAYREFCPKKTADKEGLASRKEVVFLPGVGVDVKAKMAQIIAEAFVQSFKSKTYVITSNIWEKIDNSLYEQAKAIAQLIKEKGMTELTLVGYSQGGDKAIDLAAILQKDSSIKLSGLVLLDSLGLYNQKPGELTKAFFEDALISTPEDLITGKHHDRFSSIKRGLVSGTGVLFGIAKDLWHIWRTQPDYKDRIVSEVQEMARVNPRMSEIEVPVILISGTADPISSPEKLVPAAEEEKLKTKSEATATDADPREEYLKNNLFLKSPYVKMVTPKRLGHHGLPFFRAESIARLSSYLLKKFKDASETAQ